jgi:uncharacterized protein involved in exopolysaccharide biosynthesis
MKHLTSSCRKLVFTLTAFLILGGGDVLLSPLKAQNSEAQEEITRLKQENARLRVELEQTKAQYEAARQQSHTREKALEKMQAAQERLKESLKTFSANGAPIVEELRAKLEAAQEQLQKSLEKYKDNHPFVLEQLEKIETLKKNLEQLKRQLNLDALKHQWDRSSGQKNNN